MKRRSLLKAVAAGVAGHFVLGAAKAQSSRGFRTFNLLVHDQGDHPPMPIVDAFAHKGNIYYLTQGENSEIDGIYDLGCTSSNGEFLWRRRLPAGLYNGIGMSGNNDLLTTSLSPLHTGDPSNSVYSVVPGDSNPAELTRLSVVPKDANMIGARPFMNGKHFGSVSNGLSIVMTTSVNALRSDPPIRFPLSPPAFRSFEILENGGDLLIVNKETGDVGQYDSASATYSQKPISGSAVSSAKDAIARTNGSRVLPANSWVGAISATGIVNGSLHLMFPGPIKAATYAWCDPTFTIIGSREIDLSPYLPPGGPRRILQLGTETAIVLSDGTVLAFPIPS